MGNSKAYYVLFYTFFRGNQFKKAFVLTIALVSYNLTFAQNSILENYIQEGLENNLQLKKEQFSVQSAITSLKEARSLFWPEMVFNAKYQFAKGGRQIDVPVGDMLNPVYNTLNGMTGTNSFPQLQNMEVPLMPTKYQETFIGSTFTLFNTDIYYNYRAQKRMTDVRTAQMDAFINVLKQQITNAYLEYLQVLDVYKIFKINESTIQELRRLNEKMFNSGIKTKDAVLDADYELSLIESKIAESAKNVILAKSYFNYLLNCDMDTEILIDSLIMLKAEIFDLQFPSSELVYNRKELTQLSSLIDVNKELVKMKKLNIWVPKVYLNTNIGFQGEGYKFNSDQFYNYQVFSLRWTLLNGSRKRHQLRQSQIALHATQNQYDDVRNQLQLEIKKSFEEYITSKEQQKSAKKALVAAEESYRLVYKKYEQNQVLWLELIDRQNKLLSAQMQLSIARYSVLVKKTNYKKSISDI